MHFEVNLFGAHKPQWIDLFVIMLYPIFSNFPCSEAYFIDSNMANPTF
jgi:hypothetical protein